MTRRRLIPLATVLFFASSTLAQGQGPLTPPPKKETKRLSVGTTPAPPPIPVEEIIQRFSANEAEFFRIRQEASYRLSFRLQEYNDKGEPAEECRLVKDLFIAPDGRRMQKRVERPPCNLKLLELDPDDLTNLADFPPFMLPAANLAYYEFTYAGVQQVDELNTYAFRIRPKRLDRTVRFFEGVIWIDDRDFAIVKTYGRFVSEIEPEKQSLPFKFFETYREFVSEKLWLPSYQSSEDFLHTKQGDFRVRLTIRYSDYKIPSTPPAPPAP